MGGHLGHKCTEEVGHRVYNGVGGRPLPKMSPSPLVDLILISKLDSLHLKPRRPPVRVAARSQWTYRKRWSLTARPPTSYTRAFPLYILALYGELIPSSLLKLISSPFQITPPPPPPTSVLSLKIPLSRLNPLSSESDQHQISPCNINALYHRVVSRTMDMITQDKFAWYFINFSPLLL